MEVFRISKCDFIHDLQGTGAARYGGRWNSKGTYVLYTAASASLSLLESLVHITTAVKMDYCIVCLKIPEHSIRTIDRSELPNGWFGNPPLDELKKIGDQFIRDANFLALRIPSAVMPEDYNVLLNPAHPDFKLVSVKYKRKVPIDERFLNQRK